MKFFQGIRRPRRVRASATNTTPDPGGATLGGLWSEYTGDPIYGPPLALAVARGVIHTGPRCAHCRLPVRHIADQGWIHDDGDRGTFGCRDGGHGMFTGTYAEPAAGGGPAGGPPACVVDELTLHGASR